MAVAGASLFATGVLSTVVRSCAAPFPSGKTKLNPIQNPSRRFALSTDEVLTANASFSLNRRLKAERLEAEEEDAKSEIGSESQSPYTEAEMNYRKSFKEYYEESKDLIKSDGGPPRWFSPLECGSRLENSPLLLYLPGIDGVGLGLVTQYCGLGKMFDIWCLHIPVKDRTSFTGLVEMVERTVRSEAQRSHKRPIYLVGESLGACLALAVAARNPEIDLILVLSNPGTSFKRSQLELLIPFLEVIPDQLQLNLPYIMGSMTGNPLKVVMDTVMKSIPVPQAVERLSQDVDMMPFYLSVLYDILPRETLIWKLKLLQSASAYANSRLHAVKAQTLVLCSAKDQLLPSQEEGQRLRRALPNCEMRLFEDSGHFLFLEDGFHLGVAIRAVNFYRRGAHLDYVSDYVKPSPPEFKNIYESTRFVVNLTSPVMLSTLENGKIVRSLAGIPTEGPVLFVGYHMLLGFELSPMVSQLLLEKNILLRGIAHPSMFMRVKEGLLPPMQQFDDIRVMGAVPVSGTLMYKLLSSKSHVLLYPGGVREACHRKGEEYKLFWPERSEFVRMAARFGAKIVPFGVVGEDDFFDVFFDYDDQMKTPFLRNYILQIAQESKSVRTEFNGEVGNQDMHLPGVLPKFPGRFYYLFGKPIETAGREKELRDKEKAHQVYLQVKSEVEKCLEYLKEKRESDPYRNIVARLAYQATHGFNSQVPTFEL